MGCLRLDVVKRFSWRMGLLTVLAISLFVRLGFWQLQRAEEKRQLLRANEHALHLTPRHLTVHELPKPYQRVLASGHFLPEVLLLDNQHYQHQLGYHVLCPFALDQGGVVMVDRGWIMAGVDRQQWPNIRVSHHPMTLSGAVYYPSKKIWLLGTGLEIKTQTLAVIESLDMSVMQTFLHKSLYPFIIRQSDGSATAYVRDWPVVSSSPERHVSYAIQWFAFAVIAAILYIVLSVKRR